MFKKIGNDQEFEVDSNDENNENDFVSSKECFTIPGREGKFEIAGIDLFISSSMSSFTTMPYGNESYKIRKFLK